MLTSDFDFDLPEDRIAQEAAPRGESRLFVTSEQGTARHQVIGDLADLLKPGDLMIVNDTRVIPARLFGRRSTGGRIEILLVEKSATTEWTALVRPGKRARPGSVLLFADGLEAEVLEKLDDGRHRLSFSVPVEPHLPTQGQVPLPPYIRRPASEADEERYQTVYAAADGAIAAPTAGLHFTPELLDRLRDMGVMIEPITLHVGIGTFKPVTARLVHEHAMEEERYTIPETVSHAVEATRTRGGAIVAVGTTVVRALESAALPDGSLRSGDGRTSLFITPGYRFRIVDRLLTNFHLPRSTLLMLVSAFAGRKRVLAAYREAVAEGYRFYSYGDAMLLDRDRRSPSGRY